MTSHLGGLETLCALLLALSPRLECPCMFQMRSPCMALRALLTHSRFGCAHFSMVLVPREGVGGIPSSWVQRSVLVSVSSGGLERVRVNMFDSVAHVTATPSAVTGREQATVGPPQWALALFEQNSELRRRGHLCPAGHAWPVPWARWLLRLVPSWKMQGLRQVMYICLGRQVGRVAWWGERSSLWAVTK